MTTTTIRLILLGLSIGIALALPNPLPADAPMDAADENGIYPYIYYPNNDSPDGVQLRYFDSRAIISASHGALEARVDGPSNDTAIGPSPDAANAVFQVCSGAYKPGAMSCTGACTNFNVGSGCTITASTQCIGLSSDTASKMQACSAKCTGTGACTTLSNIGRAQCPDFAFRC